MCEALEPSPIELRPEWEAVHIGRRLFPFAFQGV